jgi:hypothetical protein
MKSPSMIISPPKADFLVLALAMSPQSYRILVVTLALNSRPELGAW